MELAMFGAGCFWGVEEAFRKAPGVLSTAVGYSGGRTRNPSYADVCRGDTRHAEVVLVEFDPETTSYEALLELFWQVHDPTQINRQGPDVGDQYRSVIFVYSPDQQEAAERSREGLARSGRHARPIATAIEPAGEFWRAEEYHQQYLRKRGIASCRV